MGNLLTAFTLVIVLNVMMFVADASIRHLSEETEHVYNCDDSLLGLYSSDCTGGNMSIINNENITTLFPGDASALSTETGNWFTDMFKSIKNWLQETLGLKYVYNIVSAPYNIIKLMQLPSEINFVLSAFWYAISILVVIMFMWGRDK